MSDTGFVGLDPELARDLAREARATGETAEHIASEVAGILSLAQVDDNGFGALCGEVGEELGLLRGFLEAKATEMELAAAGMYVQMSTAAGAALWESLTDDAGEGVDFDDEPTDEEATVTMSSSVAASALAEYLGWLGDDAEVDYLELQEIVDNEDLPPEVRAAAQYFVLDGEVLMQVPMYPTWPVTQGDLENFVATNAALAVFATNYDRFDTADQEEGTPPDGNVSFGDMQTVADNANGEYTDAEQEAARWLLEHAYPAGVWDSREALTYQLYTRRVFTEHPELAVDYLQRVQEDPGAFVADYTWFDTEGGRAWMNAALASTSDPQEQAEILLGFAAVYHATMPEPIGLLDVVHGLLDGVSFIDPTQLADAVNAGIYVLEGDNVNAAIAAGGILIPLGGGAVIRMGRETLLNLATHRGDEFAEALLKQAINSGELTDDIVEGIVRDIGDQFGDDAAAAVRRYLDDLRDSSAAGDAQLNDVVDSAGGVIHPGWLDEAATLRVPVEWGSGVPTRKGVGIRWTDPLNPGNGIRIDQGNPLSAQVTQQVDHVIVRYNGQVIGRDGLPITGSIAENAVQAHIPLSEWLTWETWFAP